MGLNVTSLTGNGLRDWLVQRVSAVIVAFYTLFIVYFLLAHSPLYYAEWRALFAEPMMKIATVITLLCISLHAWVGIWTVLTDYIKCSCMRLTIEVIVGLALLAFFLFGIQIIWSV